MNKDPILKDINKFTLCLLKLRWQITLKTAELLQHLEHKCKQIYSLLTDENLKSAIISPIQEPIEGARFQIGKQIHALSITGECRRFQICGVQSGGFSNVYTVIDLENMQAFCLKGNRALPKDEKLQNEELKQEADVWLQLGRHPNLVSISSVFYINRQLHILIEYIAGQSLSSRLKKSSPDVPTALKYAIHLCRGLMHTQKVCPNFIHSDIKPANCLITQNDTLKLTDFGLAYFSNSIDKKSETPVSDQLSIYENDFAATQNYIRGGTYAYMPPEKFSPKQFISVQSDIYSFGITLFEILTGQKPFNGPNCKDYCEQHKFQHPPVEILQNKSIPAELIELVLRCLAKSPSERPESFSVIKNQLDEIYLKETKEELPEEAETPLTASELVRRGISFAVLEDFGKAEICFEEAINLDSSVAEIWAQKSLIHISTGQLEKAVKCSLKALSFNSCPALVLYSHACVLNALGQFEKALRYLNKILQIYPKHAQTLNLKGEILLQFKQHNQAAKCFKKSFAYDSFHAEPIKNLANLYISNGELDRSLFYAKKAFSINNNNPGILKTLGDVNYKLKNYPNAIESYKKSIELGSAEKSTRKQFVKSCCEFYQSEGLKINRNLIKTLSRSVNFSNYPPSNFIEEIIELLRVENHNPLLLYFLDDAVCATLNETRNNITKKLVECLWNVFETSKTLHLPINQFYSIGKIFYFLERFDDCLKVFTYSLKQKGADEKSFYYLAACYEVKGNLDSSNFYYGKALKLNGSCELNRTGKRRVEADIAKLKTLKSDFKSYT